MAHLFTHITFDTIAGFRAFPSSVLVNGETLFIAGSSSMLDGTPGIYTYNTSSSASDDGFLVLKSTDNAGNGRAIRQTYFDQVAAIVPTGAINMWGATSAPSGWLLCDGSAVSRAAQAALFAVIGTTYGMGDGTTTFAIPDMRQRFPLGLASSGTGNALGQTGGIINHNHTVNPPSTNTGAPSATVTGLSLLGIAGAASDTHTHTVDIAEFNSGENNPPFITVNYIIKT